MSDAHAVQAAPLSLQVPGGPRLEYVERGDPAGPAVLFLHGYCDSWRSFAMVLPHLPSTVRAIAISQRGHGDSDRPPAGYAMTDFAADAAGVLDALGVPRAVVVGHSMGARVAERLAADHPDRVRALVLAGAFAPGEPNAAVRELAEAVAGLGDPPDPELVAGFQASTAAGPLPPGVLEMAVEESLKVPTFVWRAALAGFIETGREAPPPAPVPTVVIWGDRDGFAPREEQDAIVAARPGSRLVAYRGVGHALHWERPERFARDVADFVEGLGG